MWNVIIIYHRVEFRIEYKNLTSLQQLEKGRVSTRKKIMKTQNVCFVIFLQWKFDLFQLVQYQILTFHFPTDTTL